MFIQAYDKSYTMKLSNLNNININKKEIINDNLCSNKTCIMHLKYKLYINDILFFDIRKFIRDYIDQIDSKFKYEKDECANFSINDDEAFKTLQKLVDRILYYYTIDRDNENNSILVFVYDNKDKVFDILTMDIVNQLYPGRIIYNKEYRLDYGL